jgi:hypothetical protein
MANRADFRLAGHSTTGRETPQHNDARSASSTIDKRLRSDPLALGFNPIWRIYGSSCNNNYYFH